ncbi:hypothetical protein [Mycobacterium paraense]|nr:hypothetical protein [Mycobacterium paraense]
MHRHKVGFYAADREETDIAGREQAFLVPLQSCSAVQVLPTAG